MQVMGFLGPTAADKVILAPFTETAGPGWVDASNIKFELTVGKLLKMVIVEFDKLNCIMSCVAVPFAAACVKASRKVPGPESALLVTVKTGEKSVKTLETKKKKGISFL